MNKNYFKLTIFITILILGFVIAMLYLSWPLLTGKTYVLSTMPVDPFDILRGQYLTIRYQISTVEIKDVSEQDIGKSIYIILEKNSSSGIYIYEDYSFEKPSQGDFIKGQISRVHGNSATIEYGIEQYFFERDARIDTRGMSVEVKISSSGNARISRLLKDGEPINITYKNKTITS